MVNLLSFTWYLLYSSSLQSWREFSSVEITLYTMNSDQVITGKFFVKLYIFLLNIWFILPFIHR